MLKVIIVDDEQAAIESMLRVCEQFEQLDIVELCHDGYSAIEAINKHQPDIVFLDVEMPECSGFDVATETLSIPYLLVFVTAFEQYAISAFETKAVDYLLKPVRPARLKQCINKLLGLESDLASKDIKMSDVVSIKDGARTYVVNFNEIEYIESVGRYQRIVFSTNGKLKHEQQSIITDLTLDYFQQLLEHKGFSRIHRSAIVNLRSVLTMEKQNNSWIVKVSGNQTLPVSRTKISEIKSHFNS